MPAKAKSMDAPRRKSKSRSNALSVQDPYSIQFPVFKPTMKQKSKSIAKKKKKYPLGSEQRPYDVLPASRSKSKSKSVVQPGLGSEQRPYSVLPASRSKSKSAAFSVEFPLFRGSPPKQEQQRRRSR